MYFNLPTAAINKPYDSTLTGQQLYDSDYKSLHYSHPTLRTELLSLLEGYLRECYADTIHYDEIVQGTWVGQDLLVIEARWKVKQPTFKGFIEFLRSKK